LYKRQLPVANAIQGAIFVDELAWIDWLSCLPSISSVLDCSDQSRRIQDGRHQREERGAAASDSPHALWELREMRLEQIANGPAWTPTDRSSFSKVSLELAQGIGFHCPRKLDIVIDRPTRSGIDLCASSQQRG